MSKFTIGIGVAIVALLGFLVFVKPSEDKQDTAKTQTVSTLRDAHGLVVDRKDSSKVYVATHTGLLMMQNDGELQRVGTAQDDYMGFSAHPTDQNTFYASGHPSRGGNLGFQKSTDGGKTWQKISDGVNGPVDFHAMAVSQVDPTIVYGHHGGQLQRSNDEGKTWELVGTNLGSVTALATSATTRDEVLAGTAAGVYVSQDRGKTWTKQGTMNDPIMAVSINPINDQEVIVSTHTQGIMLSVDGGNNWSKLEGYSGSMVTHLAYDPQNTATMYLINQDLEIHKTNDGGKSWQKIR